MDRLGPDNCSTLQMKWHVLNRARAHLKVLGWSLVWNALLTKKLPPFLSRLSEINGGREKILTVSGSFWRNLKFGEGLLALSHFFDLRTVKKPSSETLLRLAELNCFSFTDSCYKQINSVVVMGTKMRPSYANFSINSTAPNLNFTVAILTTVSAPLLLPERNSINL